MRLSDLLRDAGIEAAGGAGPEGGSDPEVDSVEYDFRSCHPGVVFVAVPGFHVDGHGYAAEAVRAGAVAVVGERPPSPALPRPCRWCW